MWLSKIENVNTVKAIYKEKEPSLNNITLDELSISFEKDLRIILRFDIEDMPDEVPNQWKIEEVNTIQFTLSCVDVSIKHLSITDKNYKEVKLILNELENKTKQVIGFDNLGNCIFDFNANWIFIKELSPFCNDESSRE